MDKIYIDLFTAIVHNTELLAERVYELNSKNQDEKGMETASIMRDDYAQLYDRLRDKDFTEAQLTKADFAKFLVGAFIISENMNSQIQNLQRTQKGYKIDTIPKLDRIVNETNTDEEALSLANEIFQIPTE